MQSYKVLIIFLAIFIILGFVAYWDEWQTKKDEEKEKKKNIIFTFNTKEVIKIDYLNKASFYKDEYTNKNVSDVELSLEKKDEQIWHVVNPIYTKADVSVVDSVLESLSMLKYENEVSHIKDEWFKFGVHQPHRIISLHFKDKPSITYYFGDKAPVGYSVYLRTSESDNVYITNQIILTETNKTLKDFRDKTLINIEEDKITKLILNYKDYKIEILKKQNGYFFAPNVGTYNIEQMQVKNYINDLNVIKVEDFNDQPSQSDSNSFVSNKKLDLVIEYQNAQKQHIQFSVLNDILYASYDSKKLIFKLSNDLKHKIFKTIWDFRDKYIFKIDMHSLTSITIDDKLYINRNNEWFLEEDLQKEQNDSTFKPKSHNFVKTFINKLVDTKALQGLNYKAFKGYFKVPSQHLIKFHFNDSKSSSLNINFWVNKQDKDQYVVSLSTIKDEFYVVAKDLLDDIQTKSD